LKFIDAINVVKTLHRRCEVCILTPYLDDGEEYTKPGTIHPVWGLPIDPDPEDEYDWKLIEGACDCSCITCCEVRDGLAAYAVRYAGPGKHTKKLRFIKWDGILLWYPYSQIDAWMFKTKPFEIEYGIVIE